MPYKGLIEQFFLLVHRLVALDSEGKYPSRAILWSLVLVLTLWLYWAAVEHVDPSFNLLRYVSVETVGGLEKTLKKSGFIDREENADEAGLLSSYKFYAGTPGGFYYAVGQGLNSAWGGDEYDLTVHGGHGSTAIAKMVYTNQRSFGIVQESVLQGLDLPRDGIRVVAPIYDEHLHLLCARDRLDAYASATSMDSAWQAFQDLMRDLASDPKGVRTGSSPPRDLGLNQYLFIMNGQPRVIHQQGGIKDAVDKVSAGELAAAVVMAGAPMPVVKNALADSNLALVSLPVDLGSLLNEHLGIRLQPHDIGRAYQREDQDTAPTVVTLSSRALLIASRDTPTWIIRRLGTVLHDFQEKGTIPTGDAGIAAVPFPTGTYPFFTTIQEEYLGLGPRFLLMLLGLVLFAAVVHWTLHNVFISTISSSKEYQYSGKLTRIYHDYLPMNQQLDDDNNDGVRLPMDHETDPRATVNHLGEGISELLHLAQDVRNDYLSGGIKVAHYSHLIGTVYATKEIFHRHLARRLRQALLAGADLPADTCERYYTAGYLLRDDFEALRRLRGEIEPDEDPRADEATG